MMGCMIGNQKTIDELSKRYPHIDLFMKVEQADILPRFLEERWTPISGAGCLDIEYMPPGNLHLRLRSEEHTSELQSPDHLVCRLLLEKKNTNQLYTT